MCANIHSYFVSVNRILLSLDKLCFVMCHDIGLIHIGSFANVQSKLFLSLYPKRCSANLNKYDV